MAAKTSIATKDDDGSKVAHAASGIGPFGKLTQLGVFQMVEVGQRIREDLHLDKDDNHEDEQEEVFNVVDDDGHIHLNNGRLFTRTNPIHPSKVKIKSTNFPRTIQSVQALLLGLFPDGYEGQIEIDASHTDVLIPDPQPRLSLEQVQLERKLSQRGYLLEREHQLEELAERVSRELHGLIDGENAHSVNFGIGEEGENEAKKLSFSQLAEIMTCLKVRDMLPVAVSEDDYNIIASHSAWKWFENLRNENLAKLAMKPFMNFITEALDERCIGMAENDNVVGDDHPALYIYSCHDSSLIGLLCAFRLEQPAKWPDYGSFVKVELFEVESGDSEGDGSSINADDKEYLVRFSLNGQILKSAWGVGEEGYVEPAEMICLKHLLMSINREHDEE